MATQELEQLHQTLASRLAKRPKRASQGFALRKRQQETESDAWRATVTKHMPESWPAARLSLQARIAALDVH
jgi:hypothetical protein